MKSIGLLLSLFFFSRAAQSQINKNYEMMGTLQLASKQIISFKINFTELESGNIEGTSLTDIFGSDRTASKIKGNIDWKNKKLSFYETENMNTKSKAQSESFCYLQVNQASIKNIKGKTIVQGEFSGKFQNGQVCGNGMLYLIGSDYLNELTKKNLNVDHSKQEDSLKIAQQQYTDISAKVGNHFLRSNEALNLAWKSDELIIDIWDARKADGDEISIYIDEKKIIDRFVIQQEKKTLVIPFPSQSEAVLRIHGLSEGNYRLCTANLTLRDGETATDVVAIMKHKENVIVKLKRSN